MRGVAERRPLRGAVGVGLVAGVLAGALMVTFIALPLFFFARAADPARGTGRPFIRTGLVAVVGPAGLVAGLIAGPLAARWYRRGGELVQREDEGDWRS